jgi:TonB family protein
MHENLKPSLKFLNYLSTSLLITLQIIGTQAALKKIQHQRFSSTTSTLNINNIMKPTITTLICLLGSALLASADIQTSEIRPIETMPFLVREHEAGKTVVLRLSIASDGTVDHAIVEEAGPYDDPLASRVLSAVKQWKFSPATDAKGEAHAVNVLLPIHIESVSNKG